MNSTERQVNPLTRLKLSVVAASLVLGGSWAMLAQSPIASAHSSRTESVPTTFSRPSHIPQTIPWAKISPQHKHQAYKTNNTRKTKEESPCTPGSKHGFVKGASGCGQQPSESGDHGYPKTGDTKQQNPGGPPSWLKYLSGKTPHKGPAGPAGLAGAPDGSQQPSESGDHGYPRTGGTEQQNPGGPPPWLKYLSGKTAHKGPEGALGGASGWSQQPSESGKQGCYQPSTGSTKQQNPGGPPPWLKYLSGKTAHKGSTGPGGAPNGSQQPSESGDCSSI